MRALDVNVQRARFSVGRPALLDRARPPVNRVSGMPSNQPFEQLIGWRY